MSEFVSCVMATKDRPGFVKLALACFLRQTHSNAELIVVDDGEQRVEALCAGLDRVRYIRLDTPASLGTKLNVGIEASRGQVIQKLDDDDYYDPRFLETAVGSLPVDDRDRSLVAWDCFLILHVDEGRLRYSGHGWRAGGTLCFPRSMWERQGFQDVSGPEDGLFIDHHQPRLIRVCAPDLYVLVRHGRNTWMQMKRAGSVDDRLRTLALDGRDPSMLIPADAVAFYRSLAMPPDAVAGDADAP